MLLAPSEWWVSRFSQVFACMATFPIKHQSEVNQKIFLACTQNPNLLPAMYSFFNKLNVYGLMLTAGLIRR